MLEIPFDETVDLFLDAYSRRFRLPVSYPNGRELVDVQTPYLAVSAPLGQYIANCSSVSSLRRKPAKRLPDDVAFSQSTTYVIQSEGLQSGDIVLRWNFVR